MHGTFLGDFSMISRACGNPDNNETGSQARSQAKARKPGLQDHMGLDVRNPDFAACEQQRCRPACASAQSDQHLYYSLFEKYSN